MTERTPRGRYTKPAGRRARRPEDISNLAPFGEGAETSRDHVRRKTQSDYAEMRRRKNRRRRILIGVLAGLFALVACAGFGVWSYFNGINREMGSEVTPEVTEKLVKREEPKDPFYMLIMGKDARPGETMSRSDTLMLTRIDPKTKQVTIVSIPRDTRVEIEGHGLNRINAAAAFGGTPLIIDTVSKFAGVPISHYAEIDFDGFKELVDSLGGIEVNVPVPIDDWEAGPAKLQPGLQTLDGSEALTFVRSRKFPMGDFVRVKHQQIFLKAVASKILEVRDPIRLSMLARDLAGLVKTDLTVGKIYGLSSVLQGMDVDGIETVTVPAVPKNIGGASYVIADEEAFAAMIARIEAGEPADPEVAAAESAAASAQSVDPTTVSIAVRNGAGVEGVATQAADRLTAARYNIVEKGNANQFVYDETLIVYRDGGEAKAAAVVEALGMGKPVPSRGMYSFESDILVVVGKDWKP